MAKMISEAGMKTGFRNPLQNGELLVSSWSVAFRSEMDIRAFREIWRRVAGRARTDGRFGWTCREVSEVGVPVAISNEWSTK